MSSTKTENQLARVRGQFQHDTNAGAQRCEGVCIALVSAWVASGGLDSLEEVADQCDFSTLDVRRDDRLGEFILARRDYGVEMLRWMWKDPTCAHMLETLSITRRDALPETLRDGFSRSAVRTLRYILERIVGYHLHDWWAQNEKRLKKERENFKRVRMVMDS